MEEGRQFRMNPEVFRAASTGNLSFFEEGSNSNLLEVTPEENTVLHVALQFNQFEVAKKIASLSRSLVSKKNSKGNTPLHVASRAGTSSIVKLLIDKANEEDVEAGGAQQQLRHLLPSMVNQDEDTALHVAVRYCNFEVVKELINEKDLAELVNKAGESALFLAVERQRYDIASHILQKAPKCSYDGRDDMNVLHALAFRTSDWPEVIFGRASRITKSLNTFKKSPDNNYIPEGFMKSVMQNCPAAIEKRDKSGWTPLEIAAFMGNEKFVKLLLEMDQKSNIAYSKDNEGSSALHIAAREGNVKVMKELISKCPDIYELLDNMGRNALHVAAESGESAAVNFFLDRLEFKGLINEQDKKGNTPMHLAAIEGHFEIASQLGCDKGVDLNSTNNDGLTTLDNVLLQDKLGFPLMRKLRVKLKGAQPSLRGVLVVKAKMADDILYGSDPIMKTALADPAEPVDERMSDSKADGVKNSNSKADRRMMKRAQTRMSQTDMLIATLITTVTFTAAFTVPGGYRSQGVDEGSVVLSKTKAFRVFLMANSLAFGLSTTSLFYNFATSILSFKNILHSTQIQRAFTFTGYSILLLMVAFVSGIYSVVPHRIGITIAVFVCFCWFSNQIFSLYTSSFEGMYSKGDYYRDDVKPKSNEELARDDSK